MAHLTVVAQNDIVIRYTVVDQDGAAVNLTSADIKWSIRRDLQTIAVLTKTTSSGIAITDAAGGIFEVTLTDTEVTSLVRDYIMEAVVTDQTGLVHTVTADDIQPDTITFRPIYTAP